MKIKANAGRFRDTRPAAPGATPGWAPVPQQAPIPRDWPTVGVVIPTRDRPELLRRTLAAVRAQDYPGRLRVIVVFDQAEPDWRLADDADRPVMVLANWRQPGLAGARTNMVLSGHVVTTARGNVFRDLYQVRPGEPVVVHTDKGQFTYRIVDVRLVKPTDVSVIAPSAEPRLTLVTCAGQFDYRTHTFSERLIVTGQLVTL